MTISLRKCALTCGCQAMHDRFGSLYDGFICADGRAVRSDVYAGGSRVVFAYPKAATACNAWPFTWPDSAVRGPGGGQLTICSPKEPSIMSRLQSALQQIPKTLSVTNRHSRKEEGMNDRVADPPRRIYA